MMLGTEDEAFLEDPLKKRKPSVSMGAATAQAGANVSGLDSYAAGLVGNQHANRDAEQAAQPGMSGFNDPLSMGLAEPPPAASPAPLRPTVGHQPRATSIGAMTQSPVDIAKAGGVTPPAPTAPTAPGPQAQMSAAIEAQKPLIDDQRQNYQADTALKQQTLADRRAEEQRKQGQRFDHSLRGKKITGVKPSNPQALSERRIGTDGNAIVSTPGLDAAGMKSPGQMSTLADQRAQIAMRNRNATQLAANPAVQAAKNRVVQETLARNGQQIATRVNGANPQMRADSLAGMPGVNSVSIREGGTRFVGGAGAMSATAPVASAPVFKSPVAPNPAPVPIRPAVAVAPSFTPPTINPVAQATPAPMPTANPGADFMDSRIAAATVPANTQAAPRLGVPSVANAPTSQIPGYDPKLPATHWNNMRATRAHTAQASGNPQTDENGLGQVASDVSGALHQSNQFVRNAVIHRPIAAAKQIGNIITDPAAAKTWAEGIAKARPVAGPATAARSRINPVFTPNPVGSLPRRLSPPSVQPQPTVMRPPIRPKKVSQSAIVNPRVNPLFKTAVA